MSDFTCKLQGKPGIVCYSPAIMGSVYCHNHTVQVLRILTEDSKETERIQQSWLIAMDVINNLISDLKNANADPETYADAVLLYEEWSNEEPSPIVTDEHVRAFLKNPLTTGESFTKLQLPDAGPEIPKDED